jgi:hypothetical protein
MAAYRTGEERRGKGCASCCFRFLPVDLSVCLSVADNSAVDGRYISRRACLTTDLLHGSRYGHRTAAGSDSVPGKV